MRAFLVLVILLAAGGASVYLLTEPITVPASALPEHTADLDNGRRVFFAAGCAACHAAKGAEGDERLVLGGGQALASPIGTFNVPNISPDPQHGIGGWSTIDFVNAMKNGVSPAGEHYYPSFPYTSYRHASIGDILDLKAFLDTLPPSDNVVPPSEIRFPYTFRRLLGLWKRFLMKADPPRLPTGSNPDAVRGQYLVIALGHCGECHTPRDEFLTLQMGRWLAGAPDLTERGWASNITPSEDGIKSWSAREVASYLESGITPDSDRVEGSMAGIVRSYADVPEEDRFAIGMYLRAIRPLPGRAPKEFREEEGKPAGTKAPAPPAASTRPPAGAGSGAPPASAPATSSEPAAAQERDEASPSGAAVRRVQPADTNAQAADTGGPTPDAGSPTADGDAGSDTRESALPPAESQAAPSAN